MITITECRNFYNEKEFLKKLKELITIYSVDHNLFVEPIHIIEQKILNNLKEFDQYLHLNAVYTHKFQMNHEKFKSHGFISSINGFDMTNGISVDFVTEKGNTIENASFYDIELLTNTK